MSVIQFPGKTEELEIVCQVCGMEDEDKLLWSECQEEGKECLCVFCMIWYQALRIDALISYIEME